MLHLTTSEVTLWILQSSLCCVTQYIHCFCGPFALYRSVILPFIKYNKYCVQLTGALFFFFFGCCRWSFDIGHDFMSQVSHKECRWQFMTIMSWEFVGGYRVGRSHIWGMSWHSCSAYWLETLRARFMIYPSLAWCGSCHHSVKVPPTPLLWFATPELSHDQLEGRAVKSSILDCLQVYCSYG